MASALPLRLLGYVDGGFSVLDPSPDRVNYFDIISYTWGIEVPGYNCGVRGVDWEVTISREKLEDIKRLMVKSGIQYLWVDCLCINQADDGEKSAEISKMYEYYKSARMCHILVDMPRVWDPQDIVDNLKFIDHILSHMGGAALASEAMLGENLTNRLDMWAKEEWTFRVDVSTVRSAAVDMGVLNCYSTCVGYVRSLFENHYFSRMWTFQEMILGKNIRMWGISPESNMSYIGELSVWMDLATDSKDKAYKLRAWIEDCRVLKSASVIAILNIIEEDSISLNSLQTQVKGISCARTDIINGGPHWWRENYKGISNVFSAISIMPRKCKQREDVFRGLLGVFSGLFTPEEIKTEMSGDDIEKISFNFFKQLSSKTGLAWTKLAISSKERGNWDWIPVVENYRGAITTDCFAGVVNLGRLKPQGKAKTDAMTGIRGVPRKYMKIQLSQANSGFQFIFKGCNSGKKIKTGTFSSEVIPTHDQPKNVIKDETGRILVQCATILGSIMDPGCDVIQYRKRLLQKLQPHWNISDPSAKPPGWIDRCVSGTSWEKPLPEFLRTHNLSMNYRMVDVTSCESRLANESTAQISCEVRAICGCSIVAPFSLIFDAITAVKGSFLGDASATLDEDKRIILRDGLGLVQVGDLGRAFSLVAFGGSFDAHRSHSAICRNTKELRPVTTKLPWPSGRALVREEFTHDLMDMMRDYGYVETGGSGNLLICRNHPMDQYKIIGVCIDESIQNKKGSHLVTIR